VKACLLVKFVLCSYLLYHFYCINISFQSKFVADGFYFCDSFGFQKVKFDSSRCQISKFYNKKLDGKIADAQNRADSPDKENIDKEFDL
jgi:hypothetical protein